MFAKETYQQRRARLRKDVGNGVILLLGNDECGMNYADNTYHYRQDSTFLYFFGLNYAGLSAVIDVEEEREIIFGDELTIDSIVWMGTQPTIKEKSEKVGVKETMPLAKLKDYLDAAAAKGRKIHYLPPYRAEHNVKLFELLGIVPTQQKEKQSIELVKAVVAQRNYKSDEEVAQIEHAVNITADMHINAMKYARPGMMEYEVAAIVAKTALEQGGELSFPIIATINGQTLHNHYHGNKIKSGDLFLLDAGAENEMCYCGDMSSTFPVDKTFTTRQKEIYQIALDSHIAAVDMLKPGVMFRDVYYRSAETIVEGMKAMGFMKGDTKEAVRAGAHALFFQCGLGHMMGMDVHDMENLGEVWVGYDGEPKSTQFGIKSLRLARKLEPGFVITIEPGIYFIPELIDMWKADKKFEQYINYDKVETYKDFGGIRNEEDFVITADGARLLGKPVPKTIEEVEALR